jgi:ferritin-like metal-binding protein YciE
MPDAIATKDAKLIQYLNEAYGKERELEVSLEAHIRMTTRKPYKRRLQDHLRETKSHARQVQGRIKELGGKAEGVNLPGPDAVIEAASTAQAVAQRAVAVMKGPLHAVRGTGEAEKMLKNARTEYWNEFDEIANYTAIETLADTVGDKETARLARAIRREEERMAKFLERQIPQLTKAVAVEEIPASERRTNGARRRKTARRSSRGRSGGSSRSRRSR